MSRSASPKKNNLTKMRIDSSFSTVHNTIHDTIAKHDTLKICVIEASGFSYKILSSKTIIAIIGIDIIITIIIILYLMLTKLLQYYHKNNYDLFFLLVACAAQNNK